MIKRKTIKDHTLSFKIHYSSLDPSASEQWTLRNTRQTIFTIHKGMWYNKRIEDTDRLELYHSSDRTTSNFKQKGREGVVALYTLVLVPR